MSTGTDTPAAAPSGPITLDQFAAELVAEDAAPEEEEKLADDGETDIEEADAEEPEEEAPEAVPPPHSWAKDDHDAWSSLTPEAQRVVLKREADRDKAVAQAVQRAAEMSKQLETFAQRAEEYAHLGDDAFERKWGEKRLGPISWALLLNQARDDQEYQDLLNQKAMYDAEKADVESAKKRAAEQSELARDAFLAQEWKALEEIAPELTDPKEGKARREKVFSYLHETGIPREVLPDISAIELKLAWKAMRFDEMDAKAKAEAKLPRRNPAAPLPKAVTAKGAGDASPNRNLQALSQRLTKSGKMDDFVSLMVAEEEQKARRKG